MLELVALVVSVVGWFATPIITKSIAAATEYARETEKQFNEVSTKLDKLAKDLKLIQTTVHKARLYFINKGEGEEILWELKGAIDEADEILDLFEYERLKNKPDGICYKFARDFTRRLDKVLENLDIARGSAQVFLENPTNIIDDSDIFRSARETGPSTRNDFFFGYAQQHGRLKRLLIVEQNKVIAIIGHGGMGKTRLARQVYHDNKLKFDVRIWAHIGNKSGELDLLTQICKSAIKSSGSLWLTIPDDPSIAVLHSKLQVLVNPKGGPQKSCLVVLDDVWQNEGGSGIIRSLRDEAWMSVLDMFKGLKNCKVVMTTRDKVCSNTVNAKPTIFLDGISEEEIMSKLLLKYIANLPDDQVRPQGLPERIADKLKGSPRAAISIVDKLKTATCKIQKANMEHIIFLELDNDHHIERLYEDHLFTFRHLPPWLQSCLAFCSIFPFDWKFKPAKLTKMWLAHGIIHDTRLQLAEEYFYDLVNRCLFKRVSYSHYVIHVHIHSMIRRVSLNECMIVDNNGSSSSDSDIVPATVRHLSVTASRLAKLKPAERANQVERRRKKKESGDEFTTVRTLLVFADKEAPSSSPWCCLPEANKILRKFKRVKVLDLTDTHITQLPDSVGELKHLRYLGFPNTVDQPPADDNKITKLLLLETVYVSKPQPPGDDMDMEMDIEGIDKIGGIGKLEKLQGSLEFHVHEEKHIKGHTMSELEKMELY
ncbi:putative disease resistance RPP13-like protein 1 [Hordeum vulgare]|nr:putative disease resistance RPP13-like protein 1 [Hordeum vulgare]